MTMFRDRVSLAGWVVIGLALVSLLQVLWITYDTRQHTQCQTELNQQFAVTIRQRAELSTADRDATRTLIVTVFTNTEGTEEERRDKALHAFSVYEATNKQLDKLRTGLAFPDPNVCN